MRGRVRIATLRATQKGVGSQLKCGWQGGSDAPVAFTDLEYFQNTPGDEASPPPVRQSTGNLCSSVSTRRASARRGRSVVEIPCALAFLR